MDKDKDIADVLSEERARGRPRIHLDRDVIRRNKKIEQDFLRVCQECENESDLVEVILAFGLVRGTLGFQSAIDAWREMKRGERDYKLGPRPRGKP